MTTIEAANQRAAARARRIAKRGEDCMAVGDLVATHRWLNVMAVKGSARAERMRAELTRRMTKAQLVEALRGARADLAAA